ncbi:MAG TPA: AraC family transcriptional regulator, partial [Bryobacteraceae bacterium]|nr:AraC family transcriptional regulator [Bryobacteraceae bacterium]
TVAVRALQLAQGVVANQIGAEASSIARVTRVVRMIESAPEMTHGLASLARSARLSRYHFLRTFEGLTGATPHQFLLRLRLRRAACQLRTESTKILQVALDCGLNDLSNFNRAFRAEFGVSPRRYRSS